MTYLIWDRKEGINLYVRQACGSFESFLEKFIIASQAVIGLSGRDNCRIMELKEEKRII